MKALIQKPNTLTIMILTLLLSTTSLLSQNSVTVSSSSYNFFSKSKNSVNIKNSNGNFNIKHEGEITLSDDNKEIISISNGGFIDIRKSSFGSSRRIRIESDSYGKLTKTYYTGMFSEKDYNPEGKAWLAEILSSITRSTTIAAASKVKNIYKKGKSDGVLSEIEQIDSDYVKAKYFELLLEYKMDSDNIVKVIVAVGNQIDSNYYLESILSSRLSTFTINDITTSAYINAIGNMDSSHYISEILKKTVDNSNITDIQMRSFLDICGNIDSDHYVKEILSQVIRKRTMSTANLDKIISVSVNIDSDHYLTELMHKVIDKDKLTEQNIIKIINLSTDIDSNHYKTKVLEDIIASNKLSDSTYDIFIDAISDMDSGHYVSEIVISMLRKSSNKLSYLEKLLNTVVRNMSSDNYTSNIYKAISRKDLSENQLILLLNNMSYIGSEYYLSNSLISISKKVKNSSEKVKSKYRNIVKNIDSSTYYKKAMTAID
ncbi:MAG: hypothetical protein HRT66_11940 [Flavobacteriaceae bacterium]|nr:hypothetical protein [Flavobacteriaceae bacterium]